MSSTTISTARVIEIGNMTAGIAVPEEGGYRFFSSQPPFDALDGRRFRSLKQITSVAHERCRRNTAPPSPNSSPTKLADPSTDLLLAIPGPFLLPV
ncbi:hypothetical protein [Microvirga calopogonii]|uniref:hypothetical protein n=1 Tax=Microvirga calopogonii TaxID=2078013 RepID=UPI000E0D9EA4|nr:hypothetical protein [Microvirga calopogonii]